MTRARNVFRIVGVLGAAAFVAGCGGGEAPVEATPTPGAVTPGATVVDPAAAPAAVDPVTGLAVDPAAAGAGASATVPVLSGDDVGGGLSAISGTPLFDAQAVEANDLDPIKTTGDDASKVDSDTTSTTTPAVQYTGAKIYVDGIVHDVDQNGTFPKGNPVFRLLGITASDIEIELVAGEFTSGGGIGTVLDKGDLVSLVNSSEQLTYKVKYLRGVVGTSAVSF